MVTTPGEGYADFGEMQNSPETFYEAYKTAESELYGVGFENEFIILCAERGLDPMNEENLNGRNTLANEGAYAATVSDYTHRKLEGERDRLDYNGERIVPEKDLIVKELVATTADYVYSQLRLSSLPPREPRAPGVWLTPQQRQQDETRRRIFEGTLRLASHYGDLIKTAAAEFPEVTPSQMQRSLANAANIVLRHPGLRQNAPESIGSAIRGAKSEVAHDQIIEKSGVRSRETTLEEDIYKGADRIAYDDNGNEVRINYKASKSELKKIGTTDDYGYDDKGTLIVNMLSDAEIGDSFTITNELAEAKAPAMRKAINSPVQTSRLYYSS